jgi:crotonobetainyl-CoA:carnitine CoA-transferase CaiB-like acyl-CoA transferase
MTLLYGAVAGGTVVTSVLEGFRILEVAEHTFVPAASAILSDWGAEVIKVEPAGRGDAMRGLAQTGVIDLGASGVHPLLEHSNRGKKSIALDLATDEGREVLYKLAEVSDVFLTNKLPRVRKGLLIDVEHIREHNPRIVYVRGSGYGPAGPDADRGGYDILGYWSRSGVGGAMQVPGDEEFVSQAGPAYGDSIGAMTIAGGICAALLGRERTGEAPVVDVSLLGTGMWAIGAGVALSLHTGHPLRRMPASQRPMHNPLSNAYKTSDGRWIHLSCLQGFHYWPATCTAVGREDLIGDPRFGSHEDLTANAREAADLLQEVFLTGTAAEWTERLKGFRGQWALVQDTADLPTDPQVVANQYIIGAQTANGTPFSLVATPVQFDGEAAATERAPEYNEHGDGILTDLLGYDWDAVIELKVKGAVG